MILSWSALATIDYFSSQFEHYKYLICIGYNFGMIHNIKDKALQVECIPNIMQLSLCIQLSSNS